MANLTLHRKLKIEQHELHKNKGLIYVEKKLITSYHLNDSLSLVHTQMWQDV